VSFAAWRAALVIWGGLLVARPCPAPAETPQEMLREGKGALEAKDFNRAEKIFAQLAKQQPSATNYAYLGVAEFSAGEPATAIEHFRQAHRLAMIPQICTITGDWRICGIKRPVPASGN